ncbi:conserved hypothetical protein, secreted [Beggiatoa sp. PS]|nr:conserved hypothetical protein, secreted [Beggiatoa sp. PS]
MSLKWPILRPSSRFLNHVLCKPLAFGLGVLLTAMFSVTATAGSTHLTNISTRAPIQGGAGDIIAGFMIEGAGMQRVVIRGWNLDSWVDPKITVQTLAGEFIADNDDWQTDSRANEISTNFSQSLDSEDAALLLDLGAGNYTVRLSSVSSPGLGLVGVNRVDTTPMPLTKLINISTRAPIQGGSSDVIAGFIIDGSGTQRVVVRGWDLDEWVNPKITVQTLQGAFIADNDDWQTDYRASEIPSNFSQSLESTDSALLLDLAAGQYTVRLSSMSSAGIGLVGVNTVDGIIGDDDDDDDETPGDPVYYSEPKSNSLLYFATDVGTSVTQNITITNSGENNSNLEISISSVSSPFSITPSQAFSLSSGNSGMVTVQCTPSSEGVHTADLQISSNAGTHNYSLECTGSSSPEPKYYSYPEPSNTLDFGSSLVGTTVNQNILTIGNIGNTDLTVNFVTMSGINSGDFNLNSPTFPLTMASGEYQAITMQCNPAKKGLREATLQLSSNDPAQSLITYPLKCQGETIIGCAPPDFTPTERNDDIIGSLGLAYDNQRDIFKPQSCLKGTTTQVGSGWSNLDFASISDYEELKRHLGIEVNFNVKATFFKMKAETKFALDHRETELSRSILFKVDVHLPNGQFNQNGLSEFGQKMHNESNQCFRSACGDQFVFQTERGGSLYMAMKFDFTNAESKKEFFAKIGGEYKVTDMSIQIDKTSNFVKETGKVTLSAHQVGGDVTKLANIFGTNNGLSPFLTCKLTQFNQCQQAMQNAINYAKGDFANSVDSRPHILGYQGVSYKDMGIPIELEPLTPEIIEARKELAYQFEWQYSDLLLTRSWLDDFGDQFTLEVKQYLRDIEQALDTNIELLSHAGMWCFSDLTLCLSKRDEAIDNLHDYNKDWLHGIQFMPNVIEKYLAQKSITLGYWKVKGSKLSGSHKCEVRSGQACLDQNCIVDKDRSYKSVSEDLPGNDAQPGIGINITEINIQRGSYAINTIEGRCLDSFVQICNDGRRFGSGGWYKGTHTIYGKCTKVRQESYLHVPPIP